MLEQFGLSNYENKAYLTILENGVSDARTISTVSEVPYGRIYDTLETLKAKRLINEIQGRPKQYTVVEPDIAISNLMEGKRKEIRELEKQAEITAQDLNKMYEQKPADKLVWKAAIGDELYPSYFEFMEETRKEFFAYLEINPNDGNAFNIFDSYLDLTKKMNSRKVIIRVILGIEDLSLIQPMIENRPEILQIFNLAEVRYTDKINQSFTIIDKEKVIIKVNNPVDNTEMIAGIYLWQKPLGMTLRKAFLNLWDESIEMKITLDHINK